MGNSQEFNEKYGIDINSLKYLDKFWNCAYGKGVAIINENNMRIEMCINRERF